MIVECNGVYGFLQFYWMPYNFSLAVAIMGSRKFKLGHSHKTTKGDKVPIKQEQEGQEESICYS